MTPKQTQRAVEIMQKHGQEGWKFEHRCGGSSWGYCGEPMVWNWHAVEYRAVGPRKRVQLKRGMEVTNTDGQTCLIVRITSGEYPFTAVWDDGETTENNGNHFVHYRWPNLETDWLPIEGEPEIISMEEVE